MRDERSNLSILYLRCVPKHVGPDVPPGEVVYSFNSLFEMPAELHWRVVDTYGIMLSILYLRCR